jgi:hypothetical protein
MRKALVLETHGPLHYDFQLPDSSMFLQLRFCQLGIP